MLPKTATVTTFMLFVIGLATLPGDCYSGELAPGLQISVAKLGGGKTAGLDSLVEVVVFLEDDFHRQNLLSAVAQKRMTRSERIVNVTTRLKSYPRNRRATIESFLSLYSVGQIREHWIVPAYTARLPLSSVSELAGLSDVRLVVENAALVFEEPVSVVAVSSAVSGVSSELSRLGVPQLWAKGLTGRGRLVCSFDTGVQGDHPALASKWRGNTSTLTSAWFSKVNPNSAPVDDRGHGTHTMGIMVGSTPADSFGVAPDAQWITAGIIDQPGRTLSATISDILEGFQWSLDPDNNPATTDDVPDVILNSWGIPKGLFAPCDPTFYHVIDAVEAAGIVTIFASGNEGPDSMSLRSPADRATTSTNSFAVGAVDRGDIVGSFSSRGPSSCDPDQIKPELVAPGVGIRSSFKGSSYTSMTGTSMAAPYIAGLVALMRQYNPDATVEEIKTALMQSAVDLGPQGEDNAYGHGLPDASRLPGLLPDPSLPRVTLVDQQINGDGIAFPGEPFQLSISLGNQAGDVDWVRGTIRAVDSSKATVLAGTADFFFGLGSTSAGNNVPFVILLDSSLYHGQSIKLELHLKLPGGRPFDTLQLSIIAGIVPKGTIEVHHSGRLDLSVSDFGQYGFGPGSIYSLPGEGLRFDGSEKMLYEAGIIVGGTSESLSSAVRDSSARYAVPDFDPLESFQTWIDAAGGRHNRTVIGDTRSPDAKPVTIIQQTISYDTFGDDELVLFFFTISPLAGRSVDSFHFGFLADFDLSDDGSDHVAIDSNYMVISQTSSNRPGVALVGLQNVNRLAPIDNGLTKKGFNDSDLFSLLSADSAAPLPDDSGDLLFVVGAGPFTLNDGDSVTIAFALTAGNSRDEVLQKADRARFLYERLASGSDLTAPVVPDGFMLNQNYPNPFNPSTTISFELFKGEQVTLDVFNVLGQRVERLVSGWLEAGKHDMEWSGQSSSGRRFSSGLYFYKLETGEESKTRKMMLLK